MMALVFAVQGSFWPLLAVHLADLGIEGRWRGLLFATLAVGSSAVPLIAGHLVDRLMATERLLSLAYAVGTALLVLLASGVVTQAGWLFVVLLLYWCLIGPTFSLCNSLSMRSLRDPRREFGWVRLWGTTGWMVIGWLVSVNMMISGSTQAGQGAYESLWVAAAVSAVVAVYCLTLPHTPPLAVGWHGHRAAKEALALARQPDVAVFLITAFGVYLTVPLVYQVMPGFLEARGLPRAWISTTMTLGQLTEIGLLAVLPWLFRRLGAKLTLSLGIWAWFLRFLSLCLDPPLWIAVTGTLLHGVGIACFTVAGQLYIDSRSRPQLRASAQALVLVCTSGVGALLGNVLAGEIVGRTSAGDVLVFLIPCVIDGALLIYFLRGFRAPVSSVSWATAPTADHPSPPSHLRGAVIGRGHLVTESADG